MSYTSGNSSKASKEVKEGIKMGFKVSGGIFVSDKDKIVMKPKETINQSIPMFDIVENSFGVFKKGKDSKGREVIVTKSNKYVKDENGKYTVAPRTRSAER